MVVGSGRGVAGAFWRRLRGIVAASLIPAGLATGIVFLQFWQPPLLTWFVAELSPMHVSVTVGEWTLTGPPVVELPRATLDPATIAVFAAALYVVLFVAVGLVLCVRVISGLVAGNFNERQAESQSPFNEPLGAATGYALAGSVLVGLVPVAAVLAVLLAGRGIVEPAAWLVDEPREFWALALALTFVSVFRTAMQKVAL